MCIYFRVIARAFILLSATGSSFICSQTNADNTLTDSIILESLQEIEDSTNMGFFIHKRCRVPKELRRGIEQDKLKSLKEYQNGLRVMLKNNSLEWHKSMALSLSNILLNVYYFLVHVLEESKAQKPLLNFQFILRTLYEFAGVYIATRFLEYWWENPEWKLDKEELELVLSEVKRIDKNSELFDKIRENKLWRAVCTALHKHKLLKQAA